VLAPAANGSIHRGAPWWSPRRGQPYAPAAPVPFRVSTCPAVGVTNEQPFCFSIQPAERPVFKRLDSSRAQRSSLAKIGRNHQQISRSGSGTHRHIACFLRCGD
jgi:hypothetical protein